MKLLVVGHTYVVAFNQSKYVEMKRQCPGLELRILTPASVEHTFGTYQRDVAPELSNAEVVDMPGVHFGQSQLSYVMEPRRLVSLLREFDPDRIHIEEDPYSACGVETVLAARLVARRAKISFFIWDNLARDPGPTKTWIKWSLDRYSLRHADLVVCGNTEGERLLRAKRRFRGRTAVLPQMGIDPPLYTSTADQKQATRTSLGIERDEVLIGFVGRLVAEKGLQDLFDALDRLANRSWRLLVLGGGPMEGVVDDVVMRSHGRVRFMRTVPHAEVPRFMQALDVLAVPSTSTATWKEQFGIVLAQAMMAGVACIGSSSGAIPEVMGPGGLVFAEGRVDDLSEKLSAVIDSAQLRRSLAAAGRSHALAHYSTEAVARAHLRAFHA